MELNVTYNPDLSQINVFKDVVSLLNQLSDCYNEKIADLENRIGGLEKERAAVIKSLELRNYEGLDNYFGIKRT